MYIDDPSASLSKFHESNLKGIQTLRENHGLTFGTFFDSMFSSVANIVKSIFIFFAFVLCFLLMVMFLCKLCRKCVSDSILAPAAEIMVQQSVDIDLDQYDFDMYFEG